MLTLVGRSIESRLLERATDGIAKITMTLVMTCDQTKSGMRFRDMPGARSLSTVTMMSTAPASDAISTNVTICDQTSTRLPGEYSGPASGT